MLRLRIVQADQPDQYVDIDGAEAVIGRVASCDAVINQAYIISGTRR